MMLDFSLATISQSRLTFALPPYLHCHHQSNMINYCLATISQTRLTFALPPVKHGWLLPCHQSDTADFCLATTSQTRLTFALPPPVRHGWLSALPPMSRTPCPVVSNVLDIQYLRLRAIYIVYCSWMNIAVCNQVSGCLTLYVVYIWKLTYSWTLYHLCDSISISIKQMSLSHHVTWYLPMWQKIS